MNKIFKEMRTQAAPDESTVSGLIEKLPAGTPRRRPKYIGGVIAAAAALCALTIGAGAVSDWTFSFLGDFSSIFGEKAAEYNTVTEASYSNSFSEYGFELIGAATDGHIMSVIVDVLPPEGQKFTEDNYPVINWDLSFDLQLENPSSSYGVGGHHQVIEQSPEKVRLDLRYNCSLPMDGSNIFIEAKKMSRDEEGNLTEHDPIWKANLSTIGSEDNISYDINPGILKFPKLTEYAADTESYIVPNRAVVGFLSVTLYGDTSQDSPAIYLQHNKPSVRLKDGSLREVSWSGGGGSVTADRVRGDIIFEFDEAIDPDSVVSLILGNYEIVFQ